MGRYLTKVETDFVLEAINLAKCRLIMDVGAEAGRFAHLVTKSKADVVGIDIDSYGLKRLRLKNKKVDLIQGDARRVPLREKRLDAVLMIEVLDYIPELEAALSESYNALKPGGALILSFGNSSSLKSRLRKLHGKTYQHSYARVMKSLDRIGFNPKRRMGYNWLPLNRTSENPIIPFLARIEQLFGLRRIYSLSPWVLVYAIRTR